MANYISIHSQNPQPRLIKQAAKIMDDGGILVYPTDSVYGIGCKIGEKRALERIRKIRGLDKDHNFTLLCRDISEVAVYAKLSNSNFRTLKAFTPGPFTFVLAASSELPRRLQHPKRKTVGVRIPDNSIIQALMNVLSEPVINMTFTLPDDEYGLSDAHEIRQRVGEQVDAIIDGGFCGVLPSTVVDLTGNAPNLVRQGLGDFALSNQ
ncbi:MAG: threonylcarbamoyl-AMP synthase [Cellvibrionales bacterium TMED148]|nr:threonylcarbamoyl-AMP synthase [Porticoccaceae bacterium]RPG92507.1 MAG: threonylcarbamoyl-AMP synthase [Cellvibrionales bacterium TMED148]